MIRSFLKVAESLTNGSKITTWWRVFDYQRLNRLPEFQRQTEDSRQVVLLKDQRRYQHYDTQLAQDNDDGLKLALNPFQGDLDHMGHDIHHRQIAPHEYTTLLLSGSP